VIFRVLVLPFGLYSIIILSKCIAGKDCTPDLPLGSLWPSFALALMTSEIVLAITVWILMIWSCFTAAKLRKLLEAEIFLKCDAPPQIEYIQNSSSRPNKTNLLHSF